MSITTKTGDDGTTSLLFGKRVSKTHPRVITCGCVDEFCSALGLCRASCKNKDTQEHLLRIQQQLVHLMSELSTSNENQSRFHDKHGRDVISTENIDYLNRLIKQKENQTPFKGWTFSGESLLNAYFDLARTTCRRAERDVVMLRESGAVVRPELIQYLNRLSDLLWLWSREYV